MITLYDYQQKIIDEAREMMTKSKNILIQLPTGGGKTILQSEIIRLALEKANRTKNKINIWIVIPRNEIIQSTSGTFNKFGITHNLIAPGYNESRLFSVHIISRDTLKRRIDKIKFPPDMIIIDEAHLGWDFIKLLKDNYANARIIGFTATPQRLDGKSLSDLFCQIVIGPPIMELIRRGFLSDFVYYKAKTPGIENIKLNKDGEFDDKSSELILDKDSVYGDSINLWEKYAKGKPTLIFTKTVKMAYAVAEAFQKSGYKFHCIEGKMADGERERLFNALRWGEIDGLTNCEIATYGLDIPRIECVILLRRTGSAAMYFQMIGRALRVYDLKSHAIIIDQVDNYRIHEDKRYPGIPPLYIEDYAWNYDGFEIKKRETEPEPPAVKYCPIHGLYFTGPYCPDCGPDQKEINYGIETKLPNEIEAEFEIAEAPKKYADLNPDQKREFNKSVNDCRLLYKDGLDKGILATQAITTMLELAVMSHRSALWVYHTLTNGIGYVDVSLLKEIERSMNYKPGWSEHQRIILHKSLSDKKNQVNSEARSAGFYY